MLSEFQKSFLDSIRMSVAIEGDQFPIWMDDSFPREESSIYLGWNVADRPDLMDGFMFTSKGPNAIEVEIEPEPEGRGWEHIRPLPKDTSVAIGTPHSGTHYYSTIVGWHHERYFFPRREIGIEYEPEVSWFAAPFVDPKNTTITHIVRDPLKVIASLKYRDWLSVTTDYASMFALEHVGTTDPFEFYLLWFWMCHDKAHKTVKLEDIQYLSKKTNASFGEVPLITYEDIPSSIREEIQEIASINGYLV